MGEKKEGMLTSAESDSPGDGAAEAEEVAAVRIQSVCAPPISHLLEVIAICWLTLVNSYRLCVEV
jgi:hypothetical protein